MQRLFSMFPAGRPGLALLLLRVALAIMLVAGVAEPLIRSGATWLLLAPFSIAAGVLLGVLTPVVCLFGILLELATWVASGGPVGALHSCAVLIATALALLGPGAYSVDARQFGRKQLVLAPRDARDDD